MDRTSTIITIEQIYSYTTFYTIEIWTVLLTIITVEQIYSYINVLYHEYMDPTATYHHCRTDLQPNNV